MKSFQVEGRTEIQVENHSQRVKLTWTFKFVYDCTHKTKANFKARFDETNTWKFLNIMQRFLLVCCAMAIGGVHQQLRLSECTLELIQSDCFFLNARCLVFVIILYLYFRYYFLKLIQCDCFLRYAIFLCL